MRSKVSVSGALPPSKWATSPSAVASTLVTLVFRWMFSYFFWIRFISGVTMSFGAGDDLVHQLDDGHLGAQRVVDRRHLQPDDAAAQHQQPLRHTTKLQRPGTVDHARIVVRDERQRHRLRSGGDDRLIEGHDLLRAVRLLD